MSQTTNTDTDQASILDQFADGDTIVDGYAGSRAGTGKTTRLVEWFRELHGDEAVWTLIDPWAIHVQSPVIQYRSSRSLSTPVTRPTSTVCQVSGKNRSTMWRKHHNGTLFSLS
jgi:hypothetical protein